MAWRDFQALQRVTTLGDRFVSYVDQGSGDPVVLLHGIPTWGYLWHHQLDELSASSRLLIPDLLGYGFSDRSDRFDRSIAQQAAMVDAWMQVIGVEQATIVGHDVGGGVALRLATHFPRRVARLCVMNSVCYDAWPTESMWRRGLPHAARDMSRRDKMTAMVRGLRDGAFASAPDDDLLESLLAPYATAAGMHSLERDAESLDVNQTMEIVPLLSRITAPTLVLWGEDDAFLPVDYAERLAWDIPDAELIRIKGARHFVMLDQPDVVRGALTQLLGVAVPV
ncbi:MAG TPA: alpha/beta hydrolase [Gemmatimonadaceae bacterium]|nr:alpha/beta hydrolase [Gemmatimonadaceae bacterium]